MGTSTTNQEDFKIIFETIPAPAFIIDATMRILDCNAAGVQLAHKHKHAMLAQSAGDALGCTHHNPNGCGNNQGCQDCAIKACIWKAIAGETTQRDPQSVQLKQQGQLHNLEIFLTTRALTPKKTPRVLVIVENVRSLTEQQEIRVACSRCQRIQGRDGQWKKTETFLAEELGIKLSHGICNQC